MNARSDTTLEKTKFRISMPVALLVTLVGLCTSLAYAQEVPSQVEGLIQEPDSAQIRDPIFRPDRQPRIDPGLADWREATPRGGIGSRIRANWVMIGRGGSISGTVRGVNAFDVAGMRIFLLRDGFATSQTVADGAGNFQLKGVTNGVYSLVGYNPTAVFAYGFNAVDRWIGAPSMPRSISTQAVASTPNKLRVSELIEQYAPAVQIRNYGEYRFAEDDIRSGDFHCRVLNISRR